MQPKQKRQYGTEAKNTCGGKCSAWCQRPLPAAATMWWFIMWPDRICSICLRVLFVLAPYCIQPVFFCQRPCIKWQTIDFQTAGPRTGALDDFCTWVPTFASQPDCPRRADRLLFLCTCLLFLLNSRVPGFVKLDWSRIFVCFFKMFMRVKLPCDILRTANPFREILWHAPGKNRTQIEQRRMNY